MKSMKLYVPAIVIATGLGGCASYPVGQYAPSESSRDEIKSMASTKTVSLNAFTASKPGIKSISCRGAGKFTFPNGGTPEEYITSAMRKELKYAGIYGENGDIQINGNVNEFDVNTNVGNANWVFDITVSKGTESFQISLTHPVKTSWVAERACGAVASQFVEATQDLTRRVIAHPTFVSWLKP